MKVTRIEPAEPDFKLEGSAEEMTLIVDMLLQAGGPSSSRRGLADRIREEMEKAGVKRSPHDPNNGFRAFDMSKDASVYFK